MMDNLKTALQSGDPLLGMWVNMGSSYTAEICATCGFDWLLIDAEHGPNDVRSVLAQLQAVAAHPVHPVVRIPNKDTSLIKRYLDIGTKSFLVPFIDNADAANNLVAATRYPPEGIRGIGAGLARVSEWGARSSYLAKAHDEITLIAQIESVEGLSNVEEIAQVEGINALFFGPADIAGSLGKIGQNTDNEVFDAIETGITVAQRHGMPCGVYVSDQTLLKRCQAAGANLFGVAADVALLAQNGRVAAQTYRSLTLD